MKRRVRSGLCCLVGVVGIFLLACGSAYAVPSIILDSTFNMYVSGGYNLDTSTSIPNQLKAADPVTYTYIDPWTLQQTTLTNYTLKYNLGFNVTPGDVQIYSSNPGPAVAVIRFLNNGTVYFYDAYPGAATFAYTSLPLQALGTPYIAPLGIIEAYYTSYFYNPTSGMIGAPTAYPYNGGVFHGYEFVLDRAPEPSSILLCSVIGIPALGVLGIRRMKSRRASLAHSK